MTTIMITLPDELAKRAKERGLLSPSAIESYVRDKLKETEGSEPIAGRETDKELDSALAELVNPGAFRRGKILGDIVGPFHDEWGEDN